MEVLRLKDKKSFLVLILAAALVITGCGKKETPEKITFVIGGAPAEVNFWKELVSEFEKETGIKVDPVIQPADSDTRRQGLLTPLKSGQTDPDVFLMDVAWVGQFAASGWLAPLDEFIHESIDTAAFFQNVLVTADTYEGSIVALPVFVDGGLLYYRKDLFKDFGYSAPPKSWDQLVEIAKRIQNEMRAKDDSFYGFVWQGAQYEGLVCNWLEIAASNGGGLIINNEKAVIESPANTRALNFMRKLIHEYGISPPNTFTEMKEEQVRIKFQQGSALFERNWSYAFKLHESEDSPVKGKVGIAPLPGFDGFEPASTLGGWHIGISKFSDRKEKAERLVEFVTSFKTQKKLALNLGWNPARKDVYLDKQIVKKMPHFQKLRAVFENLTARPNVAYYTVISQILQENLNAALAGRMTPKEALEDAQTRAEKIILRYR